MTGAYGWTGNELLPCGDLVPAPELNARRRRVGVKQGGVALAAEFVGADQRAPDSLLARARAPTIRVMGDVDAGLVTDRAAEQLQGLQVALARKEEPRPAVVPDRPRRLGPIAGAMSGRWRRLNRLRDQGSGRRQPADPRRWHLRRPWPDRCIQARVCGSDA